MNHVLLIIGAFVLIASVFGLSYSSQQQNVFNQAEDVLSDEQQNWELIEAVSTAGTVLGIILLIAGLIPKERYSSANM
jgi:hypothetical protein